MTHDRWDLSLKMTLLPLPLSIHSSLRQSPVPAWKPPVAAGHSVPRPPPTRGAAPPSAGARGCALRPARAQGHVGSRPPPSARGLRSGPGRRWVPRPPPARAPPPGIRASVRRRRDPSHTPPRTLASRRRRVPPRPRPRAAVAELVVGAGARHGARAHMPSGGGVSTPTPKDTPTSRHKMTRLDVALRVLLGDDHAVQLLHIESLR